MLVHPQPVTTTYTKPTECVLFDAVRDANPFFHLMEALWMLGGRNDAEFLNRFVKDFGSRYAEEDGILHGAYGYRWRHGWPGIDQLGVIIERLRQNPNDRRIVLQMWDPDRDVLTDAKDIPCNTQVYFRADQGVLDMTVTCRSNDIVWGCYGANAVHFSFLQQYVAGMVGIPVGMYHQVSNNWHAYYDTFGPIVIDDSKVTETGATDLYTSESVKVTTLVHDTKSFDKELKLFLDDPGGTPEDGYTNYFFRNVARPMYLMSQTRDTSEIRSAMNAMPRNSDWELAARQWLGRRGVYV